MSLIETVGNTPGAEHSSRSTCVSKAYYNGIGGFGVRGGGIRNPSGFGTCHMPRQFVRKEIRIRFALHIRLEQAHGKSPAPLPQAGVPRWPLRGPQGMELKSIVLGSPPGFGLNKIRLS